MVAGIIFLLLLIDQAIKLYVKLHFRLGESVEIFPWWQICFVENNGMAFGMQFGGQIGKFALSALRIVLIVLILLLLVW